MNNPAYSHEKQGTDWDKPLSREELAESIGRTGRYVNYMKSLGFEMPGGRSTIRLAMEFLKKHPNPPAEYRKFKNVQECSGDK